MKGIYCTCGKEVDDGHMEEHKKSFEWGLFAQEAEKKSA